MKDIQFHLNWAAYKAEVPLIIKVIYRTIGFVSVLLAILSTQLHLPEIAIANINIGLVIANKAIYEFCQFFHCPFPADSDTIDTEDKKNIEKKITPILKETSLLLPIVEQQVPQIKTVIDKLTEYGIN